MPFLHRVNTPAPPADPATITLESLGTHPTIAATASVGRRIWELASHDNRIYLGYGDYGANTGPTDVAYFDPVAGSFGSAIVAPSEAHMVLRIIGGSLYVPRIDSHWNPPEWDGVGGYATDAGGTWVNVAGPAMIHTFDVASLDGSDLWLVGSAFLASGPAGVAYRTTDGGETWTLESTLPTGETSRIKSAAVAGGKLYLLTTGAAVAPVLVFDGSTWTDIASYSCGSPLYVVNGTVIGPQGWLNGSTSVSFGMTLTDVWTDGTAAYGLKDSTLYRAVIGAGAFDWVQVGVLPSVGASSVAVRGNDLYVGTASGSLYRALGIIA